MARRSKERIMKDAPYDMRDKDAEMLAATSYVPRKSSRNGALIFNLAVFALSCAVVLGAGVALTGRIGVETVALMLIVALLAVSSVHIALSWEKVVVLRFGNLNRVVGPGLYLTVPIIEHGTIREVRPHTAIAMHFKTVLCNLPITDEGEFVRLTHAQYLPNELDITPETLDSLPAAAVLLCPSAG